MGPNERIFKRSYADELALHDLSPYASLMRYEEGKFEITNEEIARMMAVTRSVLEWSKDRIK